MSQPILYRLKCFLQIAVFLCFLIACRWEKGKDYSTWEGYRRDDGSNAYSQLNEIDTGNVKQLKVAWTYRTGDKSDYFSLECSPIIINDILSGISPKLKTFALDAKTGKQLWMFDPFDRNRRDGGFCRGLTFWESKEEQRIFIFAANKLIAAQITKQGYIFLSDSETSEPLFPIEEKPAAISKMPGEQSWPTQPAPLKPLTLCRQKFDESMVTDISPEAHDFALKEAKKYARGNIYLPPSSEGTIQMPGIRGGAEWSVACVDIATGIMYVWINDIPNIIQLVEKNQDNPAELSNIPMIKAGEIFYQKNCAVCHGKNRMGNNSFPPLLDIGGRLKLQDVKGILQKRGAMMPSFNTLLESDKDAIIAFYST